MSVAIQELHPIEKPYSHPFLEATYQPDRLFDFVLSDWAAKYDAKTLRTLVLSIQDQPQKEQLLALKEIRKSGMRLVDLYKLVSVDHTVPAEFVKLIWGIGDLRDAADFPDIRTRLAGEVLQSTADFESAGLPALVPAPFSSFSETYDRILTDIRGYLAKDELTFHHYHKLRYRVRTLRHYFALIAEVTGDTTAHSLSELLKPVSVEIGKDQDQIVNLKNQGILDIHREKTQVAQKHLAIIAEFLALQATL